MSKLKIQQAKAQEGIPTYFTDSYGNAIGVMAPNGGAAFGIGIPNAACDNTTVDSLPLATAVAAAGSGGTITLTAGKTYLIDRNLALLPKQTLYGNGATIKRVAQVTTTTTDIITSGTTRTFNVATGTGKNFQVGQTINAFNGSNYSTQNLVITSIVGDVITTVTTVIASGGSPWSGTTTIVLSFSSVTTDAGVRIENLIFDGNYANWTKYHWEVTNELQIKNGTNTITKCTINNAPGEGIVETNASNVFDNKILNNSITNINGNGIHLSTSTNTNVSKNYIYNTNIDGANVGHNGGCITISNNVVNYNINNNTLDTGRAGVGQIDSAGNSFFNISNNIIHNTSTYVIEIRGPIVNITDGLITGNRFYNDTPAASAALIAVDLTDTSSGTISRMTVSGNSFYNVGFAAGSLVNSAITGNTFHVDYTASDIYHDHIKFGGAATNVIIANNTTKFGQSGLVMLGNQTGVTVSGNSFNNGYYYGINAVGGTSSNVLIIGNSVLNDTNVNTSYQGITTNGNTVIKNNNVNIVAGHSGIRVNGTANTVVQGNTVRGQGAGKCIRVETSSTGYVVTENQFNYALVDTPAVSVRATNNDIIV